MRQPNRIVIVGGGITGLAAAYELSLRQVPCVLLEASPRLGGLVHTEHVDGLTIDAGADSLLAAKPAAVQLCDELGLRTRLMTSRLPRTAFVLARGALHALPSPSVFGIPTSLDGIANYELLPLQARRELTLKAQAQTATVLSDDESVASFYSRHFGPATVDLIAAPLLGGIHAGDVSTLSIHAVAPRLVDAVSAGRLWRSAAPPPHDADGLFRAIEGGMREIVDAIAAKLPPGSIRLNAAARNLSRSDDGWTIEYVDRQARAEHAVSGSGVILATPAHAAASLLANTDDELSALCAAVPYASTASIALAWPRSSISHPLSGSGFVVANDPSRPRITACTWVSSKWDHRAPEGTALLRAFLGGATDPDALTLTDEELIGIATRELSAVLGIAGPPAMSRIYRWPRAGAQHVVGHARRLSEIEARLASRPRLFLSGSGFHSIGLPDCIADGRAAAVKAITSLG